MTTAKKKADEEAYLAAWAALEKALRDMAEIEGSYLVSGTLDLRIKPPNSQFKIASRFEPGKATLGRS